MSDIIQDKDSIGNLNEFLNKNALPYFIKLALKDEDWSEFEKYWDKLSYSKDFDSLESYKVFAISKEVEESFKFGVISCNKDIEVVKDLIFKVSYIKNFGGSLSLSLDDLNIIESIRVFSEQH